MKRIFLKIIIVIFYSTVALPTKFLDKVEQEKINLKNHTLSRLVGQEEFLKFGFIVSDFNEGLTVDLLRLKIRKSELIKEGEGGCSCICQGCDKRLKNKASILKHIEDFHLGIRHICDFPGCDYSITRSFRLKQHKIEKHSLNKIILPESAYSDILFASYLLLSFSKGS